MTDLTALRDPYELSRVLSEKELFVFDMDGTIYLGGRVFPFAVSLINKLRASGKKVLFFTNNASHNPDFYVKKLSAMGFDPRPGELLTAGDVTVSFLLSHRAGKKVYLVGTPELEEQFRSAGIVLSSSADIVVTSFDTTLTYEKLRVACDLIRSGAEYLSTHPDFNCPVEGGFIPDSGAIAALITASTGVSPVYFGKPYASAASMMSELTAVPFSRMCVFGDRLYTDIAIGKNSGITATLVLTGESTLSDVSKAPSSSRPDFIVDSLADVEQALF